MVPAKRKHIIIAVLVIYATLANAEELPKTTEDSKQTEDDTYPEGIVPRQDNSNAAVPGATAINFIKGAGDRISSGAQNLIKGVENFVVGVLGVIDNAQVAGQIQEALKATTPEEESTTADSEEEENTTPTTPTTKRTTRKRIRTTTTTKMTTERTTRRKISYRTRATTEATTPELEYSDPEIVTTTKTAVETALKTQQQQAVPQFQQPIYQPVYQPIYLPIQSGYPGQIPQYQQQIVPGLQQQPVAQPAITGIRTQEGAGTGVIGGGQQPTYHPVGQPVQGVQPLYQAQQVNPAAVPGQQVANPNVPVSSQFTGIAQAPVAFNTSAPIQSFAQPLNPSAIQSSPGFISAPVQVPVNPQFSIGQNPAQVNPSVPIQQQNLQPVVAAPSAPFAPQPVAIAASSLSLPENYQQLLQALKSASITTERVTEATTTKSTKPPSRLAQYSINRNKGTRRTTTTTEKPISNLFGTIRLPGDDPSKLIIAPNGIVRPDIPFEEVRIRPPSSARPPPPPPPSPEPEEGASSVQPEGEESSTAEPEETVTEEPEESENTDSENDNARKLNH